MKKLITLLLVLTGMVTTAKSADIYLKGTLNNWTASEDYKFVNGQLSVDLTSGNDVSFKLWEDTGGDGTWYGSSSTIDWQNFANSLTFDTSGGNCTLKVSVTGTYVFTLADKTLSVTFPEFDGIVYFYNTLNWPKPYVYILNTNTWDTYTNPSKGAGSKNQPNAITMTQIGSSDIWMAKYPLYVATANIAFTKNIEDSYDNFYDTEVVYRTDYDKTASVFVPNKTSNGNWNSTNYYSNGGWYSYDAPSTDYTRTGLTVGNFGTICLPYNATVTGATVYTIKNKLMSGDALLGINLEPVNVLEAGKPYIFKASETTLTATYFDNYISAIAANGMMGNLTGDNITVPADVHYYVIGNNEIHEVVSVNNSSNVTVGQYKAYITLEGIKAVYSSSSREDNFIAFENGEATGISQIENGELNNENCFDLQGRRVAQPTKGLYIMNGKKVIIK